MAANVKINLENLGITPDFITNDAQILKTRYIDQRSGQHMLRVDSEPSVPEWNGETLLAIDEYDAIIISDYNKGFLSYEKIEKLICSTDCPVFIDTKKTDLDRFSGDRVWIKINESSLFAGKYVINLTALQVALVILDFGQEGRWSRFAAQLNITAKIGRAHV